MNSTMLDFDMADRMRRALRVSGVSVNQMASRLRVSRNTIGNWINGRSAPRERDLRDFAEMTGAPIEWIETGKKPESVTLDYKGMVSHPHLSARPQTLRGPRTRPPGGQRNTRPEGRTR